LIRLESGKIRVYWDRLQDELKGGGLELETWALEPRSGHFYARAVSDRVFIEGKGIKGIRTIGFPDFEKAAKHYNDYIDEAPGIKQKMRDEVGYNTPYALTLIHHIIEKGEPEPIEPIPRLEKQTVSLRLKYVKSSRRR
jgi:hypothetical protein